MPEGVAEGLEPRPEHLDLIIVERALTPSLLSGTVYQRGRRRVDDPAFQRPIEQCSDSREGPVGGDRAAVDMPPRAVSVGDVAALVVDRVQQVRHLSPSDRGDISTAPTREN